MKSIKFIALLILSSCLLKAVSPSINNDADILYTFDLSNRGFEEKAADEMLLLYKNTKRKIYLKNALFLYSNSNIDKFNQLLNQYEPSLKNDTEYKRLKALSYIRENKLDKARQLIVKLSNQTNSIDDIKILAQIELLSGNNDRAYDALLKLYKLDKSDDTMLLLSQAFSMGLNKLLPYIDEFYKSYSCENEQICLLVAEGYLKIDKNKEAMKIYDKVFSSAGTWGLNSALTNLSQGGFYDDALFLLEKFDPQNLQTKAELYALLNRSKDASDTYAELFAKTQDPVYITLEATYEYEAQKSVINQTKIKEIDNKFKKAIKMGQGGHELLNNYGYFLIDSGLDVKNGLEIVKQALSQSPKNIYYLDSLAWGYFKLGECEKAQKAMQEAITINNKFTSIIYVKEHIDAIKNCKKKEDK